ncbi:hypothetical protein PLICRDRAFT_48209 [Plicaturopsis crispa FD-325 SS-3]|nr:hypothetical protein PLICRDRAFT_48209 [Plicaturopsis crispa FD-325 SS-3]
MSKSLCVAFLAFALSACARCSDPALTPIKLAAPDGSIKAHFIARGAATTNVFVKDKHGKFRDVILGFDNHTEYASDALGHPYFGPIVGRYANRIKNGTFSIPISSDNANGTVYHVPENENNGTDTLHGGLVGFDRRNWTVAHKTGNSVTFTLVDPAGMQGFPGEVNTTVTYTLEPKAIWNITIHATASEETPILLSGHHYWNLEAYQETQDLSGHFAQFNSSRILGIDSLEVPNGTIIDVNGTAADFRQGKSLGTAINETTAGEYCGPGCVGFDNCFLYDDNDGTKPIFSLWSNNSGIKLDVTTDQTALQLYTCDGIYNASLPIPRKKDQGGPSGFYEDHSCVVVEQQGWIDAINNPQWNVDQIYSPQRDYHWESKYQFSVVH